MLSRVLSTALLCAVLSAQAHAAATLILRNADVWTVDDAKPTAQAVAVEGTRILKVGSDAEIMKLKGPEARAS